MAYENVKGKVVIVTGANTGIGRVTARELALAGAHVFLACRSREKTEPVLQEIAQLSGDKAKVEFLPLDLGDLKSVCACAESFLARNLPLHILVNNAGLAGQRGMTSSGFELSFGTCHIGHFLLTELLLDRLIQSAPSRIVVVASEAHRRAKTIDFGALNKATRNVTGFPEYAVAKLSNVLFTSELGRRLAGTGVTTYALHPGVVGTDVWRSVPWPFDRIIKHFMLTADDGAKTTLYCATHPALQSETGLYYEKCQREKPSKVTQDAALAKRLWEFSEAAVKTYLPAASLYRR